MDSKIRYWLDLSDYDLETAEALLQSKRYLYVGFMCHQAIEKAFKGLFVKMKEENAPFSHSLSYLAKKGGFYEMFDTIQTDFIDQLEPLNIEARYPSYKQRLLSSLSEAKCRTLIHQTKDLQEWIKKKL